MCQTSYIGGRCRYLHRRDVLFMITIFLFQIEYKDRMFPDTQQDDHSEAFNSLYGRCHNTAERYRFRHPVLFAFYKFRNVSVRKCRMVQLAKFFMQLISISTKSLNEMKLSLRPIISTATRQ